MREERGVLPDYLSINRWVIRFFPLLEKCFASTSAKLTLRTQSSHIFIPVYAVLKFECVSVKTKLNPTALPFKLPTNARHTAPLENYASRRLCLLLRKVIASS